MMLNSNKPKIRFKGFNDDWEKRKFDEVVIRISTGLNPRDNFILNNGGKNYYVTIKNFTHGHLMLDSNCDMIDDSALEMIQQRSDLQKDDILFTSIGRIGDCYLIKSKPKNWNINESVFTFRPNKKIVEPEYLFHTIHSDSVLDQIMNNITGSTFKSIKIADLKNADIPITSKDEQIKLSQFISNIDNLITLHQRKYEKLVNIKKSMLEKMFPKNSSKRPEIRYKGFTEDWEQRKLSSIASMHARIGWQNLRTSEFLDNGKYLLITGTDFIDGRIDYSSCHYVEKKRYDQDRNIQVSNGSILITKDGTLGKVALIQGLSKPATLNAGVFNVLPLNKNNTDTNYLFQYLKAPFLLDYVNKKATGGTIKHLNQNILVDFPINTPNVNEQAKLGRIFYELDNLITLHQSKYNKLIELKKSLLKKMFI